MDTEGYAKHVNKTGLVPMYITRNFTPYAAGQIAGFTPEQCVSVEKEGFGKLATSADMKAADKASNDAKNSYAGGASIAVPPDPVDPRKHASKVITSDDIPNGEPERDASDVVIPEDYKDLNQLKAASLAGEISGRKPNNKADALVVIEAELERRRLAAEGANG